MTVPSRHPPPPRARPVRCRALAGSFPSPAVLAALALALAALGCLAPRAAPSPRWFRPPLGEPTPAAQGLDLPLRLRSAESSPRLGDRLATRASDVEFGRHELLRWTDEPATYLQQALEAALFGSGRLARSQRASVPVLETRLVAFDDVLGNGARRAEVAVDARLLASDGRTLLSGRYEAARPIAANGPEPLVRELGAALMEVAEHLARDVAAALAAGDGDDPSSASRP